MPKRILSVVLAFVVLIVGVNTANAQAAPPQLTGSFAVAYEDYSPLPFLVGLIDASGYFTGEAIALPAPADQVFAKTTGNPGDGRYTLPLPTTPPKARAFDVTGAKGQSNTFIYDVRLMSDIASRGYMVPNEDNIASSLRIDIEFKVVGGKLIVYAGDANQQFPTGPGADNVLFTADDPRAPLEPGWSVIDLDQTPYAVNRAAQQTVDLPTTGLGDVNDYSSLTDCTTLMTTFLDRVSRVYPFTDLYKLDWDKIRADVLSMANAAKNRADCERAVQKFGNSVPDGHVNFFLPTLQNETAGGVGMVMVPLSDGRIAVSLVRPDGPAAKAGIQPGAIITAWEGKPIAEALKEVTLINSNSSTPHGLIRLQLSDIGRGPLGSRVDVTFENPGMAAKTSTLVRDRAGRVQANTEEIPVRNNKLPSGVGYLYIPSFVGPDRLPTFDRVIDQFIDENVPAIILDLRGNGGGFSQMSDAMASRFFKEGFVVGRTYSQDGRLVFMMRVEPRGKLYTGAVAVIVDANTASSGDLFAYTLQQRGRAQIVGETPSAGMAGTVSGGQYFLPEGGFIQVPTGGLVDDNNQIIVEGKGVIPDVLVPVTVESLLSPRDEVLWAAEAALLEKVGK